jgi:hypothetical protein
VPIALFGDSSYNKDSLRKLISTGCEAIPGTSTINFDPIAKQQIFKAIDTANMQQKKDLIQDYKLLKYRLGRMPMMCDFLDASARDPYAYVSYSKSYFNLISEIEPEIKDQINPTQKELLELFSLEIANAKRIEEVLLMKQLLIESDCSVEHLRAIIEETYHYTPTKETIDSLERNLNFEFVKNPKSVIDVANNRYALHASFKEQLNNTVFSNFLNDVLNYAELKFNSLYQLDRLQNGFILGEKYSRKDVCRILNWDKDISSTVYGYRTQKKMTPCFVTYKKSADISSGTQYNDHFIDTQTFAWESRSNRKLNSSEIQDVVNSDLILLFVKKSDGEGTDFYCLGEVSIVEGSISQAYMPKSNEPVVHFKYKLKEAVEEKLYQYLVGE